MPKRIWRTGTAAQFRQRDAFLFGLWPAQNARRKRNAKRAAMPTNKAEAREACEKAWKDWNGGKGNSLAKTTT